MDDLRAAESAAGSSWHDSRDFCTACRPHEPSTKAGQTRLSEVQNTVGRAVAEVELAFTSAGVKFRP